ncbi:MAG: DUF560 domain-containing protein [Deltaproteobacteria bacterium]|nr:DUF560 domain-containing protein [Deltaproteobacteria bacterium]
MYQTLHNKLSTQDIQYHLASASANYQIESTTVGLQYGYNYIYLDNKSLNAAHMLTPSLGIFLSPKLYSHLTYEYHDKKSFRDKNENAKVNAGGFMQYFYLSDTYKSWLNIGYKYNDENAVNNQYDFAENIFTAGGQIPLFEKLIFTPAVNYTEKEFKEDYTGQTVKRKDRITNLNAALAREIVKNHICPK